MENIVLTIHLLLALALIGIVLLQRSEGGGLGLGGGGDNSFSGRGAASALSKITWFFAIAFIITSISLTVLAARKSTGTSVIDRIENEIGEQTSETETETSIDTESLMPPTDKDKELLVPSAE